MSPLSRIRGRQATKRPGDRGAMKPGDGGSWQCRAPGEDPRCSEAPRAAVPRVFFEAKTLLKLRKPPLNSHSAKPGRAIMRKRHYEASVCRGASDIGVPRRAWESHRILRPGKAGKDPELIKRGIFHKPLPAVRKRRNEAGQAAAVGLSCAPAWASANVGAPRARSGPDCQAPDAGGLLLASRLLRPPLLRQPQRTASCIM